MKKYYSILFLAAVIAGCGGGGGDSKPNDSTSSSQTTKQARPQLTAEDATFVFNEVGSIVYTNISNVQGTITYQVLSSTPSHVIQVDDFGQLQLLRPGTATIKATDSSTVYESSDVIFTITVDKGINTDLVANELNLNVLSSGGELITVRGQKGDLSFEVVNGSEHLIRVDQDGRVSAISGSGQAQVRVHDSGNDYYQPRDLMVDVHLYQIGAEQLQYASLSRDYREGLTLEPIRLDKVETQGVRYTMINSVPDDEVAEILDPHSGLLLIKNTGQVTIEATATYSEGYIEQQQTAQFNVVINQGVREAVTVSNISENYQANAPLYPQVSKALGDYYFDIVSGQDVVRISDDGSALLIQGVGRSEVDVIEKDLRNFPSTKARMTVDIEQAPHPTIDDVNLTFTYQDGLSIPLAFKGQKGTLKLKGELPQGLGMSGDTLYLEQAGDYTLTFEDDGGDYYQSTQFKANIQVAKAQGLPLSTRDYEVVYSKDYQFNLLKDFDELASGDEIEMIGNTSSDVANMIANGIVHVYKAGETTLTLRRKGDVNHTPGPEQQVKFKILSAPSRINIASNIEDSWNPYKPLLDKPAITGTVGNVTYKFAEGAPTDVVSLDVNTGEMHILNVGSTQVVVADSGDDKFTPGESSFTVSIKPIESQASVSYPNAVFDTDKTLTPVVTDNDVQASYRLINQASPVVRIKSTDSGELDILHAGDYAVEVTLTGRNYLTKTMTVNGSIEKANHPGLDRTRQTVSFEPYKRVELDLGTAIGTRSYEFANTVSEELATLDPAKGALTLVGYQYGHAVQLKVSESETRDYKALAKTFVTIPLELAASGEADQYTDLDSEQTVVISTLSAPEFSNLQESSFGLMGARTVRGSTDAELVDYGKGEVVYLQMKPTGSEDPTQYRGVWMHIARFDGCYSQLSEHDTKPFQAIDYADSGYCESGSTIRMTRFLVIDDRALAENTHYELVSPLIHYRRGARKFLADDHGGFYPAENEITGKSKYGFPKSLYEWAVVNFNYQKS
ncbi:cadherin repeat domain-containing protein [Vibrio rotiferianus]|uniref:cadherin repeat domain-containing protein n=1 Tax=Vibrio rotiferianus TaxID=190895 RepID=UPI00406A2A6E